MTHSNKPKLAITDTIQGQTGRYDEIFKWLLGESGDFPESEPGKRYNWRSELRERLGHLADSATPTALGSKADNLVVEAEAQKVWQVLFGENDWVQSKDANFGCDMGSFTEYFVAAFDRLTEGSDLVSLYPESKARLHESALLEAIHRQLEAETTNTFIAPGHGVPMEAINRILNQQVASEEEGN